jgi:hypothetical protein
MKRRWDKCPTFGISWCKVRLGPPAAATTATGQLRLPCRYGQSGHQNCIGLAPSKGILGLRRAGEADLAPPTGRDARARCTRFPRRPGRDRAGPLIKLARARRWESDASGRGAATPTTPARHRSHCNTPSVQLASHTGYLARIATRLFSPMCDARTVLQYD